MRTVYAVMGTKYCDPSAGRWEEERKLLSTHYTPEGAEEARKQAQEERVAQVVFWPRWDRVEIIPQEVRP